MDEIEFTRGVVATRKMIDGLDDSAEKNIFHALLHVLEAINTRLTDMIDGLNVEEDE